MVKNGEGFYGEFGSNHVKNSPFFAIFHHNFLRKIRPIQVGLCNNLALDPLMSSFLGLNETNRYLEKTQEGDYISISVSGLDGPESSVFGWYSYGDDWTICEKCTIKV